MKIFTIIISYKQKTIIILLYYSLLCLKSNYKGLLSKAFNKYIIDSSSVIR